MNRKFIVSLIVSISCSVLFGFAQKPKRYNAAEILLKLEKLQVLGNVLYVAAHPDDENTRLITYMANEKKVNTAYFSFTRGDGGQNLIGPEIQEKLGLIRTNELLEARKIDNGKQFFSRAVDFGYSKHPDETFNIWDKEQVLGDLVWVIRTFKPDVIITRFNTLAGTTHGHHTASAMLAGEAFELAADKSAYPGQLKYTKPWQPTSLYWNAYWWRRSTYMRDTTELIKYDIGKYNDLLGLSYSEIAATSRSSHRSQGFGATGTRGVQYDYLQHEKGYKASEDIFEKIDISWNRVKGGKGIEEKIKAIIDKYDSKSPSKSISDLLELRSNIKKIDDEFWRIKKVSEIDEIIYAIAGLFLEVKASDYTACPGDSVFLEIEAINRSDIDIELKNVKFVGLNSTEKLEKKLKKNGKELMKKKFVLTEDLDYSQPFWLKQSHSQGMFSVQDQNLIGKPENGAALEVEFQLEVEGKALEFTKPVIYKRNDPVKGEVYKPFLITPPVYANISGDVNLFTNHRSQKITVYVRAGKSDISGTLRLDLPDTWNVTPALHDFSIPQKNGQASFEFEITPPENQETAFASAIVELNGKEYNYSYQEIDYDHIPFQLLFDPAKAKFVKLDLTKGNQKIGYVAGAGDNIPENLKQIGFDVDLINDMEFTDENLDQYDVVILGIRALNTVDRMKFDLPELFSFVDRGGNLIIQYNTSHRLVTQEIAPYKLELSRKRVTVEDAKVSLLKQDHEVLNYPNKITELDFEGWVQERGLYFPDKWSNEFDAILESHDPGEDPLKGGLLVARYGKGYYVYSGYSWFRELPAGVPGAYRLFVNMISLGSNVP